jgi:hypothetical protein
VHALLNRGRRAGVVGAAIVAIVAAVTFAAPRAGAEYQTVVPGLQQWLWVTAQPNIPMTAAAVRPDGWLVVATGQRFDGESMVGGGLLLVPPNGGAAVPFGDPPDPEFGTHSFTSLVLRGDHLFGLTSIPDLHSGIGQRSRLVELDARTGKVLAIHGTWWFPDLAVDPRTNDLVLWNFRCTGECGPRDNDEQAVGGVTHDLVRYDPESRRTTAVLVPDPMVADVGGSSGCQPRRGELYHCEEVFRVAFSHDGNTLFLGTSRPGTNAVDVRDRNGAFRFSIPLSRAVDAMTFGAPSTCLADTLLLTSYDGTAWGIPNPTADSGGLTRAAQIAGGGPVGSSAAALTPAGDVLTLRRTEGVVLACPARIRPDLPPAPAPPRAASADPVKLAAAPAGPNATPAAPTGPAAAPANTPPPVQPPSLPAVAGPSTHATQAVTSVNIGLADAEEEQPMYSLLASRRPPVQPAWASLGVGTAAAVGFAAVAFVTIPMPRRDRRIRFARTGDRSSR